LRAGRGQYGAFAGTVKNLESDLFFRGLDLVSHGWLGNAEIFSGLIEIPCFRELKDEFNLLGIQIQSF
jgi:hypothetical protein